MKRQAKRLMGEDVQPKTDRELLIRNRAAVTGSCGSGMGERGWDDWELLIRNRARILRAAGQKQKREIRMNGIADHKRRREIRMTGKC